MALNVPSDVDVPASAAWLSGDAMPRIRSSFTLPLSREPSPFPNLLFMIYQAVKTMSSAEAGINKHAVRVFTASEILTDSDDYILKLPS